MREGKERRRRGKAGTRIQLFKPKESREGGKSGIGIGIVLIRSRFEGPFFFFFFFFFFPLSLFFLFFPFFFFCSFSQDPITFWLYLRGGRRGLGQALGLLALGRDEEFDCSEIGHENFGISGRARGSSGGIERCSV
jgi:hypothetical protein